MSASDGLSNLTEELLDKYAHEKAKTEVLLDMLKQCEWSARKVCKSNGTWVKYCPICRGGNDKGHKKDCSLKKVLDLCQ